MQAKSYELQQFHKRFFIYGGIAYLVYAVFAALVLWLRGWQLWVTLLLGCLLLGSAYVAGRRSIGTMSRELRAIVDIMNQILEAPEQVPAEPYKQGELGELYTNLYKLVQALKESNRKEQEEKIFLRDIMSDISHQLKTPLGCGIAESELKNIFKRFYRINKEVNPNSVGIGLSLTKSIVEGMGGKISVRSELGCYTQFILTFVHT